MRYNSKLSDYQVKKTIRHFCADVEASKTALLTGFNRNTVNRCYGIFRQEIFRYQTGLKEKFYGRIEVDESYFGGKRQRGFHGKRRRGRGTLKQPVFGIFERDGRVYTEIVPDCRKQTLQALALGKFPWKVSSDSWRGYGRLVDVGYSRHLRVNHGQKRNKSSDDRNCSS